MVDVGPPRVSRNINRQINLLLVERKELNRNFSSRRANSFVERSNRGGSYHVPGVSLSINFERFVYLHFSHGYNLWHQDRLGHPELVIMEIVNDMTDREGWHVHINDFSTCRTWREQAFSGHSSKSDSLWEWCVFELRKKAVEFASSRSVFVLDSASRIRKSDRLVGSDLFKTLRHDTRSLHLSPWMFPLVFEVSPIRIDGRAITRDNFLDYMTVGAICPRSNWGPDRLSNGDPSYYSGRSQWLATDVKFSNKDNSVFLISPINNLHAARHKPLYAALEYLISDLIDDWNGVLLYKALARGVSRVKPQLYRCSACSEGAPGMCSCPVNFRESLAWANDRQNNVASDTWHESRWNPILALDGRFASSRRIYDEISLRDGFKERGLQIYVEIVSIELDADGSISADSVHHLCWDLNGNRNERIVATSLISLRRKNLEPVSGGISFRTETKRNVWQDRPNCEHSTANMRNDPSPTSPSHSPLSDPTESEHGERIPSFQELGTIKLPEGRVVTYPNTLQHRFEVPKLKETSTPGSIQFMQIHLVDPHYVVCSTRFVPPQSLDCWKEAVDYQGLCLKARIPYEISAMILDFLLVPEILRNRKRAKVRGPQSYWQTWPVSFDDDDCDDSKDGRDSKQPRLYQASQPPIRYESALRRKKEALQRHQRVMRAVNGPRAYSRPRAITVWAQSMLRDLDPIDGGDARERVSTLAGETESDAGDSEEDDIADFESPMTIAESSGSEGSADEEGEPTGRTGVGGSALNRIRYGPENGTGQGTVGSSVDGIGVGDGNGSQEVHDAAGAAAVLQAENAGEESEEGEDYVDAVYCFTTAGALEAEVVEHPWQGESEQELESLYDDAMSRADEMEPDRVTQ